MITLKAKLEGLGPALAYLEQLERKVRTKLLRKAVTKASQILVKELKARAPRNTGLLAKSQGSKIKVYRGSGIVVAIVGSRTQFKQSVTPRGRRKSRMAEPTRYDHLVAKGSKHNRATHYPEQAIAASESRMAEAIRQVIFEGAA